MLIRAIPTLLLMVAATVSAAERPADYAYGMNLEADGRNGIYELKLPAAVYSGVTRADLGDVRVFNGAGAPVPHALLPAQPPATGTERRVVLAHFPLKAAEGGDAAGVAIRLRRGPGGVSRIEATANDTGNGGAGRLHTVGYLVDLTVLGGRVLRGLELEWDATPEGFAGTMKVDASDDLAGWRTIVSRAPLVALEFAGRRLEQKRIELYPGKVRYLRLSWGRQSAGTSLPELTGVTGELAAEPGEPARDWRKALFAASAQAGEFAFDAGGRFPADRARVHLPELNTVAEIELLARDRTDQPWRPVTGGVVYRLRRDGAEIRNSALSFGATAARYWLLRVDQRGGGVGNGGPGLELGWMPHRLIFAARGEPPFVLAYGNRDAQPAAYAIETLLPDRARAAATNATGERATVGPHAAVAAARALEQRELGGPQRLQEAVDWKRWTLWGALVVGVLILGAMAWRLLRQLDAPGDGGDAR